MQIRYLWCKTLCRLFHLLQYKRQETSNKLQVASCKLQVASSKLQVESNKLQVATNMPQETIYKYKLVVQMPLAKLNGVCLPASETILTRAAWCDWIRTCMSPYSIPLWTILTKCPEPVSPTQSQHGSPLSTLAQMAWKMGAMWGQAFGLPPGAQSD